MYEAFEKLEAAKKDRIKRICLEEFSLNGYEKTLTDVIAKKAGISKGILFHYFKSKKNLFIYLVNYAMELLSEKVMNKVERLDEEDFFERLKLITLEKQKLYVQFYYEYTFASGFNAPACQFKN